MDSLENSRKQNTQSVCTTLANPIKIMDYLELREAILGIALIFYFGIIFTNPLLLTLLLIFLWGVWPQIRSEYQRGIVMQKLYRWFGLSAQKMLRPPKNGRFCV